MPATAFNRNMPPNGYIDLRSAIYLVRRRMFTAEIPVYLIEAAKANVAHAAKPQWEFPRLCRGGSKSLTYPAVDTVGPSTKLRIVSRQAHEKEFHRWMTMKA